MLMFARNPHLREEEGMRTQQIIGALAIALVASTVQPLQAQYAWDVGVHLGGANYLGEMGGKETNSLSISNLPPHNHSVNAVSTEGNQNSPTGNLLADTKTLDKEYSNAAANTIMNPSMVGITGNGTPVNNMQPYLSIGYYIATEGIFPPRD